MVKKQKYETIIGLEIHCQINSDQKLFSGSSNKFAAEPNTCIDFFDLASPGSLPKINPQALQKAVAATLVLNGEVQNNSSFDRKHYFYPDLPSGFQITQYYQPIMLGGSVKIIEKDESEKIIELERMHIEQDAGKLTHDNNKGSLVDYNRAGVGLMEIVTSPCLRSSEEVRLFLKKLQLLLRYSGASDADMEKGSFRCDVNISIREFGSEVFNNRVEVKNLNSFKFIVKAIEYEISRQSKLMDKGEEVHQETRLFDVNKEKTFAMREKKDANSYHYYPDGNIPPIMISDNYIESVKQSLPELPDEKFDRYISSYGMTKKEADFLVSDFVCAEWFDSLVKSHKPKVVITWLVNELLGQLKKQEKTLELCSFDKDGLSELILRVGKGDISARSGKEVLTEMINTGKKADTIIEEKGLKQIDDTDLLGKIIDKIIHDNPKEVQGYKEGKERLMGFFVGLVMKETKGSANPGLVTKMIKERI